MFGFTNSGFLPVTANALMPINPYSTTGYDKAFFVILRDIATPTGINEVLPPLDNLKAFPNPSSEIITIDDKEGFSRGNPRYTITDILGRESYIRPVSQRSSYSSFDISHLSPGQYILSITCNGNITRTIFIKN